MTDHDGEIVRDKNFFDKNNQEGKSREHLGQTFCRSLMVFLSQLAVILLNIFGCLWKIHLSTTCDESNVWVGIMCIAAGFSDLAKTMNRLFSTKMRNYIIGRSRRDKNVTTNLQLAQNRNLSNRICQNLHFLSTLPATLWCYANRKWKFRVCSRCKVSIYRFVNKYWYKTLDNISRFMWRDLKHRSICWYCYCWRASWIEFYLH